MKESEVLDVLQISSNDFYMLKILFSLAPVSADLLYKQLDRYPEPVYYRDQILRLKHSKLFNALRRKEYVKYYKNNFRAMDHTEKIDIDIGSIIKETHPRFGDALDALPNVLEGLQLALAVEKLKKKGMEEVDLTDIERALCSFRLLTEQKKYLNAVFLAQNGIYQEYAIEDKNVCYFSPVAFKEHELDVNTLGVFGIYSLFYTRFLGFVIKRLEKSDPRETEPVFAGIAFSTEHSKLDAMLRHWIRSLGGSLQRAEDADVVVTDRVLEEVNPAKKYLSPQYVADCVNSKTLLEMDAYSIWNKAIPVHEYKLSKEHYAITDEQKSVYAKRRNFKIDLLLYYLNEKL